MTNEELKTIYNEYRDKVYTLINQKKNGVILFFKIEYIDMLNKIHTDFTTHVNDLYVNSEITSTQWETLLVASFKLYRKAVHSL